MLGPSRYLGTRFFMAKELPYFQFEPAEYLTGNIQFCSLETQGAFINICSIYWQRSCELSLSQLERKFNKKNIDELILEGVIKVDKDSITIEFLNEQFFEISSKKQALSEAGKKGAEIKKQATLKPPYEPPLSIREDKIKEDKIKEEENTHDIFAKRLIESDLDKQQIEISCKRTFGIELLKQFNAHLGTESKKHYHYSEYKKHFRNWLSKKPIEPSSHTPTKIYKQL